MPKPNFQQPLLQSSKSNAPSEIILIWWFGAQETFLSFSCWKRLCLVTNIIQNIIFCVQQKKEIHTGLEQLKGDEGTFIFGWTIPLITEINIHFSSTNLHAFSSL